MPGDPSALIKAPTVRVTHGYTPSEVDVRRLHAAPGRPRDRLLAYWMYYAPSRRQTFSDAVWSDFIGLDNPSGHAVWNVVGKGGKVDQFRLHPLLRQELVRYRRWQMSQAERNPAMRASLMCDDTSWVIMTRTGKKTQAQALAKMLQRRAVRAGVGVRATAARYDAPGGITSKLTPHALRRAWATHALNHPENPVPIQEIQRVLKHADVSTTLRHYAATKPETAQAALVNHRL